MKWSVDELSDVRVFVGRLLDEIGLRSYMFNVEQDEDNWIVSVDFARRNDWQTMDLRIDKKVLQDCMEDPESRQSIRSAWKEELAPLGK